MIQIYLSGRFTVNTKIEKAWLKRTGCRYRCFSFAFVNADKPIPGYYNKNCVAALKACEEKKIAIMMDSGAFSLHTLTKKSNKRNAKAFDLHATQERMFESYATYCLANRHKWAFYITLDFKQDQQIIYDMQQKFLVRGLEPVPVYHGDSDLDWLRKHKDMGHKYICIGGLPMHRGSVSYYLDKVFNYGAKHGLEYHGLAMTSLDTIISWPFKSVDSSTWSRVSAFGMVMLPDVRRRRLYNIHVSERGSSNQNSHHNMTKFQKDALSKILADHGFDLEEMKTSENERHNWNGYLMSNLDKFAVVQEPKRLWDNLF